MAGYVPSTIPGGIQYTPVSYTYGQTSQSIGGGFSFNLPFESVAAFTNAGLEYANQNSASAKSFLTGVIGQAQGNLGAAVSQSATYGNQAFNTAANIQDNAISKFFKGSGCFITTAVMTAAGAPDDCPELQALRAFRDNVLMTTDTGKALVQAYYDHAPAIVAGINALTNAASIYNQLHNNFIRPAIQQIAAGNHANATDTYVSMVMTAAKLAGVAAPAPAAIVEPAATAPEVAAPIPAPIDTLSEVTNVVKQLAPLATALIPGAGPAIAIAEEVAATAPIVEPLFMEAIHSLGNAAASLEHLFHRGD
jgi:hypothetical protein